MHQAEPHHDSRCSGEGNALLTRHPAAGLWPLGQSDLVPCPRTGSNETEFRFGATTGED